MKLNPIRVVAGVAALGVTAAASLAIAAPASSVEAKTGIGKGRALVYVEAPTATVTKTGKNSYRMVLPPGSTGQWMGERTDAEGNTRTRVGDLTAKKLSKKWTSFRYGDAAVPATLAWMGSDAMASALVRLSRPKVTDSGVRFDFTSKSRIPSTLEDVSINVQRAPGKSQARSTDAYNFQVSGDLWIGANVVNSTKINTRVYNSSNNNTCWTGDGAKTISDDMSKIQSVTANTCANVQYSNSQPGSSSYPDYGVSVQWPAPATRGQPETKGTLTYLLFVTPPDQAQFKLNHQIISWS